MENINLKQVIDTLKTIGNYHVCIHDVSGILKKPCFSIDTQNTIHSMPFCDMAKSTRKGFDTCMNCKNRANQLAIYSGRAFSGLCAFGLYEAAMPVIIEGKPVCIIYLGNGIVNREQTLRRLTGACAGTKTPAERMIAELSNCQETDEKKAMMVCRMLDSYIRFLYEKYKDISQEEDSYHWAVQNLKNYADLNYSRTFTLESVCRLYFVNEKYAGKLFKEQTGLSFHEYLTDIRLRKAAKLLISSETRIIDVAMQCGFNNVTYFNRIFRKCYQVSPGEYRKLYR